MTNYNKIAMICALGLLGNQAVAMSEMSDDGMSDVVGQALFVADKIVGPAGGSPFDDFTFYRVGFDAELEVNMNIDKLQLGCGGANDNLIPTLCDIDLDFVSLMGMTTDINGSPVPGNPANSNFILRRPYFEFAIKNDDVASQREVVGIKIGTESATGLMSIGRQYANGQTNAENGGTCNTAGGNGNAAGRLACHSGINSISGNLGFEMSGYTGVNLVVLFPAGSGDACFGYVRSGGPAGTQSQCGPSNAFTTSASGTRMTDVVIANVPLKIYNQTGLLGIASSGVADISESLRMTHRIFMNGLSDFGLSLQREQVAYPNFSRTGFLSVANTGWWFNLPGLQILDTAAQGQTINGLTEVLAALGEGLDLVNLELNQPPVDNCWGTLKFC